MIEEATYASIQNMRSLVWRGYWQIDKSMAFVTAWHMNVFEWLDQKKNTQIGGVATQVKVTFVSVCWA